MLSVGGQLIQMEALEYKYDEINLQMPYVKVVDKLRTEYNTLYTNISLQFEVDSLNFDEFIAQHQIQDEKESLRRMGEYLSSCTP